MKQERNSPEVWSGVKWGVTCCQTEDFGEAPGPLSEGLAVIRC